MANHQRAIESNLRRLESAFKSDRRWSADNLREIRSALRTYRSWLRKAGRSVSRRFSASLSSGKDNSRLVRASHWLSKASTRVDHLLMTVNASLPSGGGRGAGGGSVRGGGRVRSRRERGAGRRRAEDHVDEVDVQLDDLSDIGDDGEVESRRSSRSDRRRSSRSDRRRSSRSDRRRSSRSRAMGGDEVVVDDVIDEAMGEHDPMDEASDGEDEVVVDVDMGEPADAPVDTESRRRGGRATSSVGELRRRTATRRSSSGGQDAVHRIMQDAVLRGVN